MLKIAVVGGGISGLAAGWLLSRRHQVTLFEAEPRAGGHSHTVEARGQAVDTGFIVYNEATYPNLTALFAHLGVESQPAPMSFAVSRNRGQFEYGTGSLGELLAQKRNLLRPRFWAMLGGLLRFYRRAPRDLARWGARLETLSLDAYLDAIGCGAAFRDDHLYPMAAAVWSTPAAEVGRYPAAAFLRFCANHGLLSLGARPQWRTVCGGSRDYVARLTPAFDRVALGAPVLRLRRQDEGVELVTRAGTERFDAVVLATHADTALGLIADPGAAERDVLGAFAYARNRVVLHSDATLMPRRRAAWSGWNYLAQGSGAERQLAVTYWMNRLQGLDPEQPLFVTLNPPREPDPATVHGEYVYHHPQFDAAAILAQRQLWSLQGQGGVWFAGAYFGSGFHEDGLQAGLAVAEQLGGVRRPWDVANESGRIVLGAAPA